ncbi:MAG TPA: alpha/beta hydrolase [Longimicrobiaceae bacterium]|nr:alpha/beta hydrolase [Longimicrobiaceae bacterium]
MSAAAGDFVHRWVPGSGAAAGTTLLLLHGTGGDEHDLLELGQALVPGAAMLSPRGKVLEGSMLRFFRRLAEGVFDEADLVARTHELAEWVGAAAAHYGFDAGRMVTVGFSNGANIASAALLLRPGLLRNAVLFRAMVPLQPEAAPDLAGTRIFMGSGRTDPVIPANNAQRLADMLRAAGADVTHEWTPGGHGLSMPEVESAARWLQPSWANSERHIDIASV